MQVVSRDPESTLTIIATNNNLAIISNSYDGNGVDGNGFECENVDPLEREVCLLLHDLSNYDTVEELPSDNRRSGKRFLLKLLKGLFSKLRYGNTKSFKQYTGDPKEHTTDESSVGSTASMSTASLSSRTLEGLVAFASDELLDSDDSLVDPTFLELLSVVIQNTPAMDEEESAFELVLDPYHIDTFKTEDVSRGYLTACTEVLVSSNESELSISLSDKEAPLMEYRILQTGLTKRGDFEFVPDFVSKEVLHVKEEKSETSDHDPTENSDVSHVKTGIWEVTCLDDEGTPKTPYYVVTGISMDDRVDTKKLRKFVFAGQNHKRRPKLAMAPTETAERLTGYKSGTMAPICHSQNMRLFLEESLIENKDKNVHRLNVGSGMFGKCLSVKAESFLQIARLNPKGLEICPVAGRLER